MSDTFADRIINFNRHLAYHNLLPKGFDVLNPYMDNPETMQVMQDFYKKFYNDNHTRKFIVGINPSRHGAGVTGVPFTDTKRLQSECGICMSSAHTHEVSSSTEVFQISIVSFTSTLLSLWLLCENREMANGSMLIITMRRLCSSA